jgi:endonuclease/exonuclease/phosphatase family metal-dependent hydrolase
VVTANLLVGRARAGAVVELAGRLGADVLFVQELTGAAAGGLARAGLGELLPYRVTQPGPARSRGSIYARWPLRGGVSGAGGSAARCTAGLELPSGGWVELVCVHAAPPRPPWSPGAARWRGQLAALPGPGAGPRIVAGDFNATVDHAQFRRLLRRGWVDAASRAGHGLSLTWGPRPGRRPALLAIDHVLIDPGCAVVTT